MVLEALPVPGVLAGLTVPLLLELPSILGARLVPAIPVALAGLSALLLPGPRLAPAVLAVPGDLFALYLRWLLVHLEAREVLAGLAVLEPDPARYSIVG